MKTEYGKPYPLGAVYNGEGVNFCLYADNATEVELCLFDTVDDIKETHLIKMRQRTHCVWHSFIQGLKPGQLYAYRVNGPYEPQRGHRYNINKLLLDPYAKAITGLPEWRDELFSYDRQHPQNGNSFSHADRAP